MQLDILKKIFKTILLSSVLFSCSQNENSGSYEIRYKTGVIERGNYINGLKHGVVTIYSNGEVIKHKYYNGTRTDSITKYVEDINKLNKKNIDIVFIYPKGENYGKFYEYKEHSQIEGQAIFNLKNGQAILTAKNGDKKELLYKDNKLNGPAIFHYSNGDKLFANYEQDQLNGNFKYFYNNGDIANGMYKDNKRVGIVTYRFNNGPTIKLKYKEGVL